MPTKSYVLISLIIIFTIFTIFAKQYSYFNFDLAITLAVQSIDNYLFDALMKLITLLGNAPLGGAVLTLGVVAALAANKYKDAVTLLICSLGAVLISETIKTLVSRPRPNNELITQIGQFYISDSYPSGHVMFETSIYGFLIFMVYSKLKKPPWLRNLLIIVLFIPIALVGLSRIYLGAHWFSDVIGAYLLAVIWLLLIHAFYKRFTLKN